MKKDEKIKRNYTYYDLTQSMCRECKKITDAQIIFRDDMVYMRSVCAEHGPSETLIASSVNWYLDAINTGQAIDKPRQPSMETNKGCPYDCGLCEWHEKACNIPILPITNVCELKCPICVNYIRQDSEYFMSVDEFKKTISRIIESEKQIDLINIIGGEPTLHPELFTLINLCKRKEIGRVTLYSNGLRIAEDEDFVKKLSEQGIRIILPFHTFDRKTAKKMYGKNVLDAKLIALDNLEKYKIHTTLLSLAIKNLNEKEISRIVELTLKKDFIRSLIIQNMPYNGTRGSHSTPTRHLTIDEIINILAKKSKERLTRHDFSSLPGAHPLCYSACHLFQDGDYIFPLKRIFDNEEYFKLVGKKYIIKPEENFRRITSDKITEISAKKKIYSQLEKTLAILRRMISKLYPEDEQFSPFERQKRTDQFIKSIYIHAPMNEDTFDLSRVIRCGDLIPGANETLIPACSYNLLYRMKIKKIRK